MKSMLVSIAAVGAVVATLACGVPSPEVDVLCSTKDEIQITFTTAGTPAIFYIHKFISIQDKALANTTPARNLEVKLIANAADVDPNLVEATVCGSSRFADCDTIAEYGGVAETETSDDGFLEYFLLVQPIGDGAGSNDISEVIGDTVCQTGFTYSTS